MMAWPQFRANHSQSFGRSRLQPCRKDREKQGALAPEVKLRVGIIIFLATLAISCAAQQQPSPQDKAPRLEQRGDANAAIPLDAQITAPVTIPTEAWGHYTFGHELDLLEVDLEPRGLTGYITLMGDKALKHTPDKNAPLTFFFAKTRVGGDSVYFLTQQIHRLSYEFNGTMAQTPPKDKSLAVGYALVGTLTTHHLDENGHDRTEQRHVEFKRVMERML